jgi:hypothetical protein
VLDLRARWQKIASNEPDAKAILPEPRSVQKAISYQFHDRSRRENRDFVLGMEPGNSKPGKPGEQAVFQAYRNADAF